VADNGQDRGKRTTNHDPDGQTIDDRQTKRCEQNDALRQLRNSNPNSFFSAMVQQTVSRTPASADKGMKLGSRAPAA
jgi:hypothetical protein